MESLIFWDYVAMSMLYLMDQAPKHLHLILIRMSALLPVLLFGMHRYIWCARSITIYFLALLLTGFVLNVFWNIFVFNKFYWQYDYSGWECSPFRLLIFEELDIPAKYFHGTHEKTIRNWHSIYLILSWTSAYLLSLFVNRALDRKKDRRGDQSGAGYPPQRVKGLKVHNIA